MLASREEIRRELSRLRGVDEREQIDALGAAGLAWLALVPAWTEELAERCRFPAGRHSVSTFVDEAEALGLCERRADSEYGHEFWLRRGEYRPTIDLLKREYGVAFLSTTAAEAARQVREAAASLPVSPKVRRWSELAIHLDSTTQAARWLDESVRQLVEAGKTGEATALLATAAPVAALFGDALDEAYRLGNSRLELAYRRRHDRRHLEKFLERREQIEALDALQSARGGAWALHVLGVGGVGKTMLIRYLTATLDAARAPVARKDFDLINPEYPASRPGHLLVELVGELLTYGLDRSLLRTFGNAVASLHEAFSAERNVVRDPVAALERHLEPYGRMISSFAGLLSSARQQHGRPVMLILDTCEELAKFQPPGSRLPSIEVMFRMLEDTHAACAAESSELPFRVLFAGRRPLARAGFGWSLEATDRGSRHKLPDRKEYLALHELRGFGGDDARRYLQEKQGLRIPSWPVYRAILAKSREAGRPADLAEGGADYAARRFRYNPFDLALYAEWLKAEPTLSAARIAGGAVDPYVEYRILERLQHQELKAVLPALVLLGRFDRALVDSLLSSPADDSRDHPGGEGSLARELADQEWIETQADEVLGTTFLQIDSNLLPRLRGYYERRAAAPLSGMAAPRATPAGRRLAPILESRLRARGRLGSAPAEYVDAALRVLAAEQAARLWADIENRIPTEAGSSWARTVLGRVIGEGGAVESVTHPLRAAVEATLASLQVHSQGDADLVAHWRAVLAGLDRHPVGEIRAALARRATLGQLAAWPAADWAIMPVLEMADILETALGELRLPREAQGQGDALEPKYQLAASICAALSNVLDAVERSGGRLVFGAAVVERWALRLEELGYPVEIVRYAAMLAGRALMLAGEGVERLHRAGNQPQIAADSRRAMERWLDWCPPDDIESRIRLEAVRAYPATLAPALADDVAAWRAGAVAAGLVDDVDRDRLAAACLERQHGWEPPQRQVLDEMREAIAYTRGVMPRCLAHDVVSRLFESVARGYVALGELTTAVRLLNDFKVGATASGRDEPTVRAAQTALLQAMRRSRTRSELALVEASADSIDVDRIAVAWPAAILIGAWRDTALPMNTEIATPARVRIWLSCQSSATLPPDVLRLVMDWTADATWSRVDYDLADLAIETLGQDGLLPPEGIREWLERHPRQTEHAFRLALKLQALAGRQGEVDFVVDRLPPRTAADIALEEAELLALRWPEPARSIITIARERYRRAGDTVGQFRAAICEATIRARAGDEPDALRTYLDDVVAPLYASLFAGRPRWPEWSDVAWRHRALGLRILDDTDWGGWLARLAVCCDVASGHAGSTESLRALYGDQLPVEVSAVAARLRIGKDPAPAAHYMRPPSLRNRLAANLSFIGLAPLVTAASMAAVFVLVAGINYGLYRFAWWSADAAGFVTASSVPASVRVAGYMGLVVALYALVRVVPRAQDAAASAVRSWLASQTGLVVTLESAGGHDGTLRMDRVEKRVRLAWPFVSAVAASATTAVDTTPRPPTEPAAQLAPGFREGLRNLRWRLGRRSVVLTFQAPRAAGHEPPWEGILAHAASAAAPGHVHVPVVDPLDTLRAIRPLRLVPSAASSSLGAVGWDLGLVRVVSSHSSAHAMDKAWRQTGAAVLNMASIPRRPDGRSPWHGVSSGRVIDAVLSRADQELEPLSPAPGLVVLRRLARWWAPLRSRAWGRMLIDVHRRAPGQAVPFRILHLVGMPVTTKTDLHWQVASVDQTELTYRIPGGPESSGYAGDLAAADDVPVEFAPVILLQAEPLPGTRARTRLDREQAAQVRAFACRLVTAGAPAVITLPALEFQWVERVIPPVTRALDGVRSPDLPRLLAAAEAARAAIDACVRRTDADGAGEAPFDVSLFVGTGHPVGNV